MLPPGWRHSSTTPIVCEAASVSVHCLPEEFARTRTSKVRRGIRIGEAMNPGPVAPTQIDSFPSDVALSDRSSSSAKRSQRMRGQFCLRQCVCVCDTVHVSRQSFFQQFVSLPGREWSRGENFPAVSQTGLGSKWRMWSRVIFF